jgi:CHAT domain-containing protein
MGSSYAEAGDAKGQQYLKKGSEAFQEGDLQDAVDFYDRARLYYDSLDQVKPCLRAGRLTFQVLLYTPLRDTTKGPVFKSLLTKAEGIRDEYPEAYWKTRLLALSVQFVQKGNTSALSRKLDTLENKYLSGYQQPNLYKAILRGLEGKLQLMESAYKGGIGKLRRSRERYSSAETPDWVGPAVRADHFFYQALAYRSLSKYDSALWCLQQGRRLIDTNFSKDHPINARLGHVEADILRSQSAPVEAKRQLNRSLSMLEEHNLIASPLGIKLYREKGNLFSGTLQPKRATPYLKKSIGLAKAVHPDKPSKLIYPYIALGRSYKRQKQFKKALKQYEKALALAKDLPESGFRKRRLFNTYTNLGNLHRKMGQYSKSAERLQKAYALGRKVYPSGHEKLAIAKTSLMTTNIERQHFKLAREHLNEAMRIYRQRLPENHPELGKNGYLSKAKFARRIDHFDTAQQAIKKAYQTFSDTHICNKDICIPDLPEIAYPRYAYQASTVQGQVLWDQYQSTGKIRYLSRALLVHQKADSLAERLQQKLYIGSDNASLARNGRQIYPYAVGACHYLSGSEQAEKPASYYAEKAFYLSEKGKTLQLLEGLSKVRQSRAQSLPDSLGDNLRALTDTINELRAAQNQRAEDRQTYQEQLVDLKTRKKDLLEDLKQEHPDFYAISFHDQVVDLEQLQRSLQQENRALLTYIYHDSLLMGIGVTPDQVVIKRLKTPTDFADKVERYRNQLANQQRYDQQLSHTFYQRLFKPFKDLGETSGIVIIPDGPISHLAFGTLARSARPEASPDYLVRDYAFTYSPSASLWVKEQNKTASQQTPSRVTDYFVGFAPSFSQGSSTGETELLAGSRPRQTLEAIPGAQQEVSYTSELLSGAMQIGSQATESAFKATAGDTKILHLATHGIVSDQTPAYNKLLFNQEQGSGEDGNLYTHELYNLDMQADLAVLSACNTGYGPIKRGQGHMSLARGFKLAGCQNVLMTLWQIRDRVSTDLVKHFYQNLADGLSRGEALRQAKLTYLESHDRANSNPHFWGGFVLMGSDEPIQPVSASVGSGISWIWWAIAASIAILGGIVYFGYFRGKA